MSEFLTLSELKHELLVNARLLSEEVRRKVSKRISPFQVKNPITVRINQGVDKLTRSHSKTNINYLTFKYKTNLIA